MRRLCMLTVVILISQPARAGYGICFKPSEPYCLDAPDIQDSCRYEIETYLRAYDNYLDCVAKDVADDKKKAVDKWNCRIKGHNAYSC